MCFMGIISETDRGYQGHGRHGTRINGRQDEPGSKRVLFDIKFHIQVIPIIEHFKLNDMGGKLKGFSKRDGRNKACHGWKISQKN